MEGFHCAAIFQERKEKLARDEGSGDSSSLRPRCWMASDLLESEDRRHLLHVLVADALMLSSSQHHTMKNRLAKSSKLLGKKEPDHFY